MGYLLSKKGYLQYLYNVIKNRQIMNTLMLIKNIEMKIVAAQYFKSENEAIREWPRHQP